MNDEAFIKASCSAAPIMVTLRMFSRLSTIVHNLLYDQWRREIHVHVDLV